MAAITNKQELGVAISGSSAVKLAQVNRALRNIDFGFRVDITGNEGTLNDNHSVDELFQSIKTLVLTEPDKTEVNEIILNNAGEFIIREKGNG